MSSSPSQAPPPTLPPADGASLGTAGAGPKGRPWKIIGAIVVAVIVVASIVIVAVVLPRPTTGTSTVPTFSGAQSVANGAANGVSGGPWESVAAVALATVSPLALNSSDAEAIVDVEGCALGWMAGATVELPATPMGAGVGAAASWLFAYTSASDELLIVAAENGTGTALFTATGGNCTLAGEYLTPLSSSTVVDSSTSVGAANQDGGAAFLAANPASNRVWAITGAVNVDGISILPPTWYVAYTSCPLHPTGEEISEGEVFNATVDAGTGTVTSHGSYATVCSISGTSLGSIAGPLQHTLSLEAARPTSPLAPSPS